MARMIHHLKYFLFCKFAEFLLLINKTLVKIVPFKKLITFYANTSYPEQCSEIQMRKAKLIHNAINRYDKILFWKPVCFEKSLTAIVLARFFHLPGTVYFGIMKTNQGEMVAHAWSQIGSYWITGYENKDEFTVVYTMYYVPDQYERK